MPQAQAQELEELNRELRQCNLQQFIQQTGAALPPAPRRVTWLGRGKEENLVLRFIFGQ